MLDLAAVEFQQVGQGLRLAGTEADALVEKLRAVHGGQLGMIFGEAGRRQGGHYT